MIDFINNSNPVIAALIATMFTYAVTVLGAALVFFFKKVNKNIMDAMLGFAAGVMIAASFFSLLAPSINMAESLNMIPWLIASIGFFSGGVLLFIGDKIFDYFARKKQNSDSTKLKRCLMLVTSISIHNIPEGMAVGVAFGSLAYNLAGATPIAAVLLALGIGLQNFPEGTAVSVPLRREGLSRKKAFFWGAIQWFIRTNCRCYWSLTSTKNSNNVTILTCFCSGCYDLCSSSRINSRKSN